MTKRTISALAPLLCVGALILAPACKKTETQNPDQANTDGTGGGDTSDEPDEPDLPAVPPQDPDPAELADLYNRFLIGDYEAVANDAAELRATLSADTQIRANALAASIQALAASKIIPENAKDPSEEAIAAGDRLGDAEVLQLAHTAHAAYLIGVLEAEAAQTELEAVVGSQGAYGMLARLYLARAHYNQAFGTGEDDTRVVNPGKLDEAAAQFQAVIDNGSDPLKAHAHVGLAATADYKNDKAAACAAAEQAT
ncbi:MAG: hypothetical protein KC431_22525, partial [Myxococcales bacterium]|nr:hypothetical protein [Myxococcales bacterium]